MMKKIILTIGVSCMLACTTSCTIETSGNGDLDGNWQLMQMDSVGNGKTTDMKEKQIFYAVQFKLLNIRAYNYDGGYYFFHFEHKGDSLILNATPGDAGKGYKTDDLRKYGINSLNERFGIKLLNKNDMIIESSLLKLKFRKF